MEDKPFKVLIVDDHTIVREALALRLAGEEDLEVMAHFGSGEAAIDFCRKEKPDMVIVDYNLTGINGIDTILKIKSFHPTVSTILLSMFANSIVKEAKAANIKWVINKAEDSEGLVRAIHYAKEGKDYLSLPNQVEAPDTSEVKHLSKREKEILTLLAKGRRQTEIAIDLNISIKTVESHRQQISKKLGLVSIPELTLYALRKGWIPLD